MLKRRCWAVLALLAFMLTAGAQDNLPAETPRLDFAMQLRVTLGQTYTVGTTPHGKRTPSPAARLNACLNNALYVCQPDFSHPFQGIVLNVWMVK